MNNGSTRETAMPTQAVISLPFETNRKKKRFSFHDNLSDIMTYFNSWCHNVISQFKGQDLCRF
jgi:hypothetical protein